MPQALSWIRFRYCSVMLQCGMARGAAQLRLTDRALRQPRQEFRASAYLFRVPYEALSL